MTTRPKNRLLTHVRRVVLIQDGAGLTDGQLLECFIAHREEAAFEALVRRHGPMVLGVCQRILHNFHDAEDAFQIGLAMFTNPLKMTTIVLLGIALAGAGTGIAYHTLAAERNQAKKDGNFQVSAPEKGKSKPASPRTETPVKPSDKDKAKPSERETTAQPDRAKIQGSWKLMVEKTIKAGSNVPEVMQSYRLVFDGDKLTAKLKDQADQSGDFKLDSSTDLKMIDFTLDDEIFRGVYLLLDDELIIAWTKAADFRGTGADMLKFPWIFQREAARKDKEKEGK